MAIPFKKVNFGNKNAFLMSTHFASMKKGRWLDIRFIYVIPHVGSGMYGLTQQSIIYVRSGIVMSLISLN